MHSEPSLLAVLRAKDNAKARQGALKYPAKLSTLVHSAREAHRYYWCSRSRRPLIFGPRGSFPTLSEIIVVSCITCWLSSA